VKSGGLMNRSTLQAIPLVGRLLLPLLLVAAIAAGCQSEDDDTPPQLRPGVFDVRVRFIDIQGSSGCFNSGGFIFADTICIPPDILGLAGIESCPFTPDAEDGHFDCLAEVLWENCPSQIRFDGTLDVVNPEHFLLFGIYKVDPADPYACRSDCQTRVSFEGRWLNPGGCRPGGAPF